MAPRPWTEEEKAKDAEVKAWCGRLRQLTEGTLVEAQEEGQRWREAAIGLAKQVEDALPAFAVAHRNYLNDPSERSGELATQTHRVLGRLLLELVEAEGRMYAVACAARVTPPEPCPPGG